MTTHLFPHNCAGPGCEICDVCYTYTADRQPDGSCIVVLFNHRLERVSSHAMPFGVAYLAVRLRNGGVISVPLPQAVTYHRAGAGSSFSFPISLAPMPWNPVRVTAKPLEKTDSPYDEPFRVVKETCLIADKDTPFVGVGFKRPDHAYGREAAAVCHAASYGHHPTFRGLDGLAIRALPPHAAPHPQCSCGFYAPRDHTRLGYSGWLIDTEFYGRIVEHSDGWRAGRQRITAVRLPRNCAGYGWKDMDMCDMTDAVILTSRLPGGFITAACRRHFADPLGTLSDPRRVADPAWLRDLLAPVELDLTSR